MTSTRGLMLLLILIVLSKGYFHLNEQFLVAFCFISFVTLIYSKYGNDIRESFEKRQLDIYNDLIKTERTDYQDADKFLINSFKIRVKFFIKLYLIKSAFKLELINYIKLKEIQLINLIENKILIQLEQFYQKEIITQNKLLNNLSKRLSFTQQK